jgi:hypothetical protein
MSYDATSQWYSYKLNNVTSTSLIFNDGTNQTGDLSRTADGWYKDGVWYNSNPDVTTNAAPVLTVSPAGPYSSATAVNVTLSATDDSGIAPTIYYTTDGTTPTTSSTSASGSKTIQITSTATLKAFALDNQSLASAVQTHSYTITPVNNPPVVSVSPAGPYTFTGSVTVSLSATDDSGTVPTLYYTVDGLTPTTSSTSAAGNKSLTFTATTTLKVFAVDNAAASATAQTHTYTLSINTGLKIHLKTTWTAPKIYYWNATPGGATSTWPGVAMVSEGSGWYTYTIPSATCSSIIFSNNGATQTANLSRCNEGWYSNGTWYDSNPDLVAGLKIHFKTTWATPKMYYWNATPGGATTTWPGVSMTSEGNGWYTATVPGASCSSIIFSNNGATQTVDLSRCNEGWYNGTWSNTLPAGRMSFAGDSHSVLQEDHSPHLEHFPNPATDKSYVKFVLFESSLVQLRLFNNQGMETMKLIDETLDAGEHVVEVSTASLSSGFYVYKLNTGKITELKKLVIQK